ncbi:protein of unknown function [Methylocaldum szegediense]|uniref:Uncharacterized protein n=1 Tax=Methylocaldum szegediense TaxID=73780 RepID=A0ABM9I739_9GAMM|nr:protein of unknown function [Methylocaldum szegediense]
MRDLTPNRQYLYRRRYSIFIAISSKIQKTSVHPIGKPKADAELNPERQAARRIGFWARHRHHNRRP